MGLLHLPLSFPAFFLILCPVLFLASRCVHVPGEMVVEDIELHSGESATGRWVRRLVFLSNQGRIQSEVPLLPPPANATDSALRPDHSQLTCSYHGGLVAGLCLVLPHLQALASRVPANRKDSSAEESSSSGSAQCLLIGLGGGTLAVFLQRYYGMQVCVCL